MDSQLGGVLYSLFLRVACPRGWRGGVTFPMVGRGHTFHVWRGNMSHGWSGIEIS